MSEYLLEVNHLAKFYRIKGKRLTDPVQQLRAVDDVSFRLRRGEVLGVVGESGCGKSTMGNTIIRLLEPTRGEILFEGHDLAKMNRRELRQYRADIQMIFQDPFSSLDPRMRVFDIIAEPLRVHHAADGEELKRRVSELMEVVGLDASYAQRFPHEFSGGQRQRIGIARALAVNPEFIVCDEPVSALDVSIQAQVINMFDELQDKLGLTYLFIAHDLLVVRHISDRIAVMYLGKMVELADAKEIYDHPLHPYSQSLISAVPVPDPNIARANKRIVLKGDIPSPLKAPSGCPFRTRCQYACDKCAESMPEFKEVSAGHFVACHRTAEIN
jgi:oligopeptide transport system ATP-binding protein